MTEKEQFYKEKEECSIPLTHIIEGVKGAPLAKIDELYGAADVLSIRNSGLHRKLLFALSVIGTLLALAFLMYDEIELHGLILGCGVMILFLFLIRRRAGRLDCHRKYLEYRVLAESLRVQFFLTYAGLDERVSDLLPWPVKQSIPWVSSILSEIPVVGRDEKRSILDCWIRDQKSYHKSALAKAVKKNKKDTTITKTALIVTLAAYFLAVVFELAFYRNIGSGIAETVRVVFKVVLGTMSAITLFAGSYYGKMSLSNVIDDHRRMTALYEDAEKKVAEKGETREILLGLARECLNENSTWYAYQSSNGTDIVLQ